MASFAAPTTTTSIFTTKRVPNSPFFSTKKTIQYRFKVSCSKDDDNEKLFQNLILPKTSHDHVDRRNLLLGLGGLYSTLNLPTAFADPITTPDMSTCIASQKGFRNPDNALRGNACCPTLPSLELETDEKIRGLNTEKKFTFPEDEKIRVRRAAHKLTPKFVEDYKRAIKTMKELPESDPHSFVQQAKIHCAYCNGGYNYTHTATDGTITEMELQIHNSWLFLPFHRWYLYFFERIVRKYSGNDDFALPYWNWDNPTGMTIPAIFEAEGDGTDNDPNPLFDVYRNSKHYRPTILDTEYEGQDRGVDCATQISNNLTSMYRQMISNAPDPLSFFGGKYSAGSKVIQMNDASIGTLEANSHTAVHRWVGDPKQQNNEDMGNFYSAGYDPLFYVHHSNVDRMWQIWKDLGIKGHSEPTEADWLDASYLFFDENRQLVRVTNKQCVEIEKLKYKYDKAPLHWLKSRPLPHDKKLKKFDHVEKSSASVNEVEKVNFPLKLDQIVKVKVTRPAKSRSKEDKKKESELLLINGIEFNPEKFVKFDVFVNDQDDVSAINAYESEFAGSFVQLPHGHDQKLHHVSQKSGVRFGLSELLEDIGAEDDESILVTLVPKKGCEDVTISGIKVELVDISS